MLAALSSAAFVRRFRPPLSRRAFPASASRAAGWAGACLAVTCEAEPAPGRLGSAGMRQKLLGLRAAGPRSEPATQRAHARHACNGPRAKPLPTLPLLLGLLGRVSVSRPLAGLDSLRAVRTLRTSCLRANGSASRLPSRLHGRVRSYVYATTSPQADMSRSKRHGLTSCTVARLCWMNFADAKRPRCWQVSVASAACGWRRSCRAPRWGETRHLFPNKPSSSGRVDGGLDRGPLQAWRAPARGRASAERGPAAVLPKQS